MSSFTSVAMTGALHEQLCHDLLRADGQEDIRLLLYAPSTGSLRRTAILHSVVQPLEGDREVHGNATITSRYVLRASSLAADAGLGVAMAHSHPGGIAWQGMSGPDRDAESAYGNLAREITGLPLVGLTLAGRDRGWSARHWNRSDGADLDATHSTSVRVIGETFTVTWNGGSSRIGVDTGRQQRTISAWGAVLHADLVRRRVLVVGLGSVGLDVAVRLAASGFVDLGFMDYDVVKLVNLDRLIGATEDDALHQRLKIDVAARLAYAQATSAELRIETFNSSICDPQGLAAALDYDVIISCVDRPWPRSVLNALAYTDLIPVIDGGIAIDAFPEGGMRNASWRTHVIGAERPCLVCIKQLDLSQVPLDVEGLLDDPEYIHGGGAVVVSGSPNVALLSASVSASLLAQFVSLNIGPGGLGDPGPLRYILSTHTLEHLRYEHNPHCVAEREIGAGDSRMVMTGDPGVHRVQAMSASASHRMKGLLAWTRRRLAHRQEQGWVHRLRRGSEERGSLG
jgi:molybdopterin-synthase adenylyltransferase